MITESTVPLTDLRRASGRASRTDGEGSLQVQLDPSVKIG